MSKISEITVEELLKLYAAGQRDFTRYTIEYTDQYFYKGIDLRGVKFRGDSLEELVNGLQNSNLSGADLKGIGLRKHCLDKANLSGAKLNKAFLWRANFNKANLSEANLTGSDLQEASFTYANLRQANLSSTYLCQTYFNCADLSRANFTNAKIEGYINFSEANLTQVDFTGASVEVSWDEINFKNAYFKDTIMPDGSVRNS